MDREFKIFEIGDGAKSIITPGRWRGEMNNDGTLLLYNPKRDTVRIRISVLTVKGNDEAPAFDQIVRMGREEGHMVKIEDDKSYIFSQQQVEEAGKSVVMCHYEVGYRSDYIIISVTTALENAGAREYLSTLGEIPGLIASIAMNGDSDRRVFEMPDDDRSRITGRTAKILGIAEADIEAHHLSGSTMTMLQGVLDNRRFKADKTFELQSMGLAFGDYIRCRHPEFRWVIVSDESGRDYALAYKDTTINIYPATMISKRVEKGEARLDLAALFNGLLEKIMEIEQEEECV